MKNAESNNYVRVTDFTLVDSEFDAVNEELFRFQFEEKGGINWCPGRVFSVCEGLEIVPAQVNAGVDWVRAPLDIPEVESVIQQVEPEVESVIQQVVEPEVEEAKTESDDDIPELVSETESEDVPVNRAAALIEEALNAKAQSCGCECGCGPDCTGCECECGCPKVEKNDA